MKRKLMQSTAMILAAFILSFANLLLAGSTSTSSTVKDGKKITTKVVTDNKGTTTTTVTTKDKDGSVTTSTTVKDKDGNLVSTDDPNARAQAESEKKEKADHAAALANAPKRGVNDPIYVALFQTEMSEDLRKNVGKDGIFPWLRKEFDNDPVIKALDQGKVDRYAKTHDFKTGASTQFSSFDKGEGEFLPADVYVESFATIEQKVGINKATKKLAQAPFLVYTAKIYSEYGNGPWEVKDEGFILQNEAVTKSFAEKIKAAIRDQVGPTIPKDAAKFRRGTAGQSQSQVDASEALKNLFHKKKK
jgi:major membrane immunogen (membrane-anchored lipoprotein)